MEAQIVHLHFVTELTVMVDLPSEVVQLSGKVQVEQVFLVEIK